MNNRRMNNVDDDVRQEINELALQPAAYVDSIQSLPLAFECHARVEYDHTALVRLGLETVLLLNRAHTLNDVHLPHIAGVMEALVINLERGRERIVSLQTSMRNAHSHFRKRILESESVSVPVDKTRLPIRVRSPWALNIMPHHSRCSLFAEVAAYRVVKPPTEDGMPRRSEFIELMCWFTDPHQHIPQEEEEAEEHQQRRDGGEEARTLAAEKKDCPPSPSPALIGVDELFTIVVFMPKNVASIQPMLDNLPSLKEEEDQPEKHIDRRLRLAGDRSPVPLYLSAGIVSHYWSWRKDRVVVDVVYENGAEILIGDAADRKHRQMEKCYAPHETGANKKRGRDDGDLDEDIAMF